MSRYDDFSLQQANQFRTTTDGSITIAEAPSQEVRLINGQLVPFTRRSNEDIYDKLVAIEEKLDDLLAK